MSLIKQDTIDRVLEASDIVDVIGRYVDLKQRGSTYVGLTPFGKEKSPSFTVNASKQFFKCFSSGKGGGVIQFLMEKEGFNFPEAVKWLADLYHIPMEYEEGEKNKQFVDDLKNMRTINEAVRGLYLDAFLELKENHPVVTELMKNRMLSLEDILHWQIGFAPDNQKFLSKDVVENGWFKHAMELGLIRHKEGNTYDFFRNRIMIPIFDINGNVVGFGGRSMSDNKDHAKYINSQESKVYDKSRVLYGINHARRAIHEAKSVFVVEGYFDVISMHRMGLENTVAPCGTAITENHCKALRRLCPRVVLLLDGDAAGMKGALKSINTFLSHGFQVDICELPDGHDPDTFSRLEEFENNPDGFAAFIQDQTKDAVLFKAEKLSEGEMTPFQKSMNLKDVVKMLSVIGDQVVQKAYIDKVAKLFKETAKSIRDQISDHKTVEAQRERQSAEKTLQDSGIKLPDGIDPVEFERDRFYQKDGGYYFLTEKGSFFKGTNFTIRPLFHISSAAGDSKRLIEITNHRGAHIVDVPSASFINFNDFKKTVFDKGNYMFLAGCSQLHFNLLVAKIGDNFPEAYEMRTLGQQNEGFYAFSDGVLKDGNYIPVDEFGMTYHKEKYINDAGEEKTVEKRFYSPAFSVIYKDTREDDDTYENDRHFVFKKAPCTLREWMEQFIKVYGEKAYIGIAFYIMSIFRDLVMKYDRCPHLFLHGEKGSGKSSYGESLNNMFTSGLDAFDLNSGTLVGFYRRLARIRNGIAYFEEFHDAIDAKMFQGLKAAFDGRGREKGVMSKDNRTETTKVNSALIISGQYLSNRDDNSLTTRSILMQFVNTGKRGTEESKEIDTLKKWEKKGMSSLIRDVFTHRDLVAEKIAGALADLRKQLKDELGDREFQERMLRNYAALLAPTKILFGALNFPFSFNTLIDIAKRDIVAASDLISGTEGVAEFWKIVEHLIDQRTIHENIDYTIEQPMAFEIAINRNEKVMWENRDNKRVVFVRFGKIHGDYLKLHRMMKGENGMQEGTIRGYIKSRKYYIGLVTAKRFSTGSFSCIALDLGMLEHEGVSLERNFRSEPIPQDSHNRNPIVGHSSDEMELAELPFNNQAKGQNGADDPF